jgi:tRNA threonylcarbamoyl adenosine modification protein YjeE
MTDNGRMNAVRVKFPSLAVAGEDETISVACAMAENVYGGLLVALSGELGAGKTLFVRAIGDFLGARGVKSPTFATESVHAIPGKSFSLAHADLYRLDSVEPGSHAALRLEEYLFDGSSLLLVEWGERWIDPPEDDRWDVAISIPDKLGARDENFRLMDLAAHGIKAIEAMSRAYSAILESRLAPLCRAEAER